MTLLRAVHLAITNSLTNILLYHWQLLVMRIRISRQRLPCSVRTVQEDSYWLSDTKCLE